MNSFRILAIIFFILSLSGGAQAVDCQSFQNTIKKKLLAQFEQTKFAADKQTNKACKDRARNPQAFKRIVVSQCHHLIDAAKAVCSQIEYSTIEENRGQGPGQSRDIATAEIEKVTSNFSEQGKKCGEALAKIPSSCKAARLEFAEFLVNENKCSSAEIQLEENQIVPIESAKNLEFCQAAAKHFNNTVKNARIRESNKKRAPSTTVKVNDERSED